MYHLIILAVKFIHNVVYARARRGTGPRPTGVGMIGMRGRGEGQVFSRYL